MLTPCMEAIALSNINYGRLLRKILKSVKLGKFPRKHKMLNRLESLTVYYSTKLFYYYFNHKEAQRVGKHFHGLSQMTVF